MEVRGREGLEVEEEEERKEEVGYEEGEEGDRVEEGEEGGEGEEGEEDETEEENDEEEDDEEEDDEEEEEEEEEDETEDEEDEPEDPPMVLIPWRAVRWTDGGELQESQQSSLSNQPLPIDVWLRIAHALADSSLSRSGVEPGADAAECCSWPLVPCAVALPYMRHALTALSSLSFDDSCRCPHSSITLPQRLRSFLWLSRLPSQLSHLSLSLSASPPPLLRSLVHSFPCLASLTSLHLFFSRRLFPPPRLLLALSRASHLQSLVLSHAIKLDGGNASKTDGHDGSETDDHGRTIMVEGEMRELISRMEPGEPKQPLGQDRRPFASLSSLHLTLAVCSPLVLRLVACLAPQLLSLRLISSSGDFQGGEEGDKPGKEDAEVPGMRGRTGESTRGREGQSMGEGGRPQRGEGHAGTPEAGKAFAFHLPLATEVLISGIDCAISLSAPRLTSLDFSWWSPHSRLLLLPPSPPHLSSLSLTLNHSFRWAFHAPHLTSVDSLRTNMLPKDAAHLPPSVVSSVKALQWEVRLSRKASGRLDLSVWRSLCCFHLTGWHAVSLLSLRSGVIWPGGLEGLFVDCIGRDFLRELKSALREGDGEGMCEGADGVRMAAGGEGDGMLGGSVGEDVLGRGTEEGHGVERSLMQAVQRKRREGGSPEDGEEKRVNIEIGRLCGCERLLWFEGWYSQESLLYVWDAALGLYRLPVVSEKAGRKRISEDVRSFLESKGIGQLIGLT
ncbi:hypothetical protein CLOM_g9882 [Closterium sp. NIES-68]|nr:hypothetical protein CLOM_g9882 [Closterium sp. NIES-68]